MVFQTPSTRTCSVCGKAATTHCAGCSGGDGPAGLRTPTLYCGKDCQAADWKSHKQSCQSAQAQRKLYRAGELLQDAFLRTRAEAFDLSVARAGISSDGKTHFFGKKSENGFKYNAFPPTFNGDSEIKRACLSYLAGGDVFAGFMFVLCQKAFQGYVKTVEELDVRMFDSRILVVRHESPDTRDGTISNHHHVVRITLKDGTVWAMDLAGAQHGQHKAILPFDDYDRDYVAKITARRPWGTNEKHPEGPIMERHPADGIFVSIPIVENLEHQIVELWEWEFHNVKVSELLKVKTLAEYQRLKESLIDHVAAAAQDYTKLAHGDPTSKAKPVYFNNFNDSAKNLSEEEKARLERWKARRMDGMDPDMRRLFEEKQAKGDAVLIL